MREETTAKRSGVAALSGVAGRGFVARHYVVFLVALLLVVVLVSVMVGRYSVTPSDIVMLIGEKLGVCTFDGENAARTALFRVRLPRIVGAMVVGAGLACAGAVFQGVFKNPMSSPDILGAATGAGLGAAFGILMSLSAAMVQLLSFAGGIVAVMLTFWAARCIDGRVPTPVTLVLTGIVVSGIFQACISLTKYVADPNSTLPAITLWLMGTFADVGAGDAPQLVVAMAIPMVPMFLLRWRLTVLAAGDEEASTLGVNVPVLTVAMILCSTLVVSVSVAYCGVIGWIGLVVPHMARAIVGADYSRLLPATALLGASFALAVDIVARSLISVELPLGILTALIGAPFFLVLLKRSRRSWLG